MESDVVNWILTGVVGVLLAFVVYYLKETFLTIKDLGVKMNKAFLIIQRNGDNIKHIEEKQALTDHTVAKIEAITADHSKDLAIVKTKIEDL